VTRSERTALLLGQRELQLKDPEGLTEDEFAAENAWRPDPDAQIIQARAASAQAVSDRQPLASAWRSPRLRVSQLRLGDAVQLGEDITETRQVIPRQ
jgi:hypothetical protein